MGRAQILQKNFWSEEQNERCPVPDENGEAVHGNRHLRYARKLFPLNVLVRIIGRQGIYRVVSEPYIPTGYSYPHFDVEAFGKIFSASVFTAVRLF